MILDFDKMETATMEHFKGGEKSMIAQMYVDNKNRIMRGRIVPGASVGLHTHEGSSEILFVLQGSAKVLYDGKEERVSAGQCHYCPEGHSHTVINDTDSDVIMYAVVPQHGC